MRQLSVDIHRSKTVQDVAARINTKTFYYINVQLNQVSWKVKRTFNEFSTLYRKLKSTLPEQMEQVEFPDEVLENRFSKEEIGKRKKSLNVFLRRIVGIPKVAESDLLNKFLKIQAHVKEEVVAHGDCTGTAEGKQLGKVLHYFTSRTDQELSVNKGDVVIIVSQGSKLNPQWIECECGGEIGYVPKAFVQSVSVSELAALSAQGEAEEERVEIDEEEMRKDSERAPPVPSPPLRQPIVDTDIHRRTQLLDALALSGSGIQLEQLRSSSGTNVALQTPKSPGRHALDDKHVVAVALFDFDGTQWDQEESALSFKKGDRIVVYQKEGGNYWWQGCIKQKLGFLPSDYVALLDGHTPDSVIAAAGASKSAQSGTQSDLSMQRDFEAIEQQLIKHIQVQYQHLEEAKRKLKWYQVGTPEYKQAFEHLEETRILHDSLQQNLSRHQQARSKQQAGPSTAASGASTAAHISVVDQLKLKIAAQNKLIELTRTQLAHCSPQDAPPLRNQLEEQSMLLQALYGNLQSLAMFQLQQSEIERQQQDNEVIVAMRKRVAQQVLVVEQCRSDLVACDGSYQQTVFVKQNLEENLTLLEALQANLDALTSQQPQPQRNDSSVSQSRSRRLTIMDSFRKKTRSPTHGSSSSSSSALKTSWADSSPLVSQSSSSISSLYRTSVADSPSPVSPQLSPVPVIASPSHASVSTTITTTVDDTATASDNKQEATPAMSAIDMLLSKKVPTDIGEGVSGQGSGTTKPRSNTAVVRPHRPGEVRNNNAGAPGSPSRGRLAHNTSAVDDITSMKKKKKKRNVRVADAADDEKSVLGFKKRYICIFCECENFVTSPPPKPENCRSCKHEFCVHRLHRIRSVRVEKSMFQKCVKAQLSFFV